MPEIIDRSSLTVLAGCYGSGKTNIALNLALKKARDGKKTTAVDLDMINPYFRMTDGKEILESAGVECLFSDYVNTNVDLPQHFPRLKPLFSAPVPDSAVIVDVGGDDTGAIALGMYAKMLEDSGADVWLVLNRFRPFVIDIADARQSIAVIEAASRLKFTGMIANPNLAGETTAETVLESVDYYREVSDVLQIPVLFAAVKKQLVPELEGRLPWDIFGIDIFTKPGWEIY